MHISKLHGRIISLANWLDSVELKSGDPFALQCSDFGIRIGQIMPKYVGGALYRIDRKFPKIPNRIFKHTIAPHSAGMFAQSCILMSKYEPNPIWAERTDKWLDWLKEHTNQEYKYTWGIPFRWLMGTGVLAPENTPMSTVTPYCSDAFYMAHKPHVAISNAKFIFYNLNRIYEDADKLCISYSPLDDFRIVNVQAYCAAQLYRAYTHSGNSNYRMMADKLINFVLSEQNDNGSWYYWSKTAQAPVASSVDSLHQCYIMQGLYRCYLDNNDNRIKESIDRCIEYCKENLITDDFYVKKFPVQKHPYELIDAAEMVSTLDMVGNIMASVLLGNTIEKFGFSGYSPLYSIPEKYPYFASWLNPRNNIPYIRWGQVQILFAMSQHLVLKTKSTTVKEIYS